MKTISNKNLQQYKTEEIEQVIRDLQNELDRRNEKVDYTGQYVYDVRDSRIDDETEQSSRITVDLMLCVGNNENDNYYVVCNMISVEKETNENNGEVTFKADLYNGIHIKRSTFATFRQLDNSDIYNQLLPLITTQNNKVDKAYKKYQEQYRVLRDIYGNQAGKIVKEKLGIDI